MEYNGFMFHSIHVFSILSDTPTRQTTSKSNAVLKFGGLPPICVAVSRNVLAKVRSSETTKMASVGFE